MNQIVNLDGEYAALLDGLKQRIRDAQIAAARAVNRELVGLYWDLGRKIVEKQTALGWGEGIIVTISRDLRTAFPATHGFSPQNLWLMRQFYLEYSADPKLQQLVGVLPWGQNVLLLQRVKDPAARHYYIKATAQFGWSRAVLLNQIKAQAYERAKAEKKTHNFAVALPEHFAEQADEMLKSRYNLEFLGIARPMKERELEERLIGRLQHFILELGYGFCFVGRQYRLALGAKEYFVDLLFYHRFLKALVAFDLKVVGFEPEFAGKMDFYLNLLNEKERAPDDRPSIGIILCAEKDDVEVEFALKSKTNPIGVAHYELQSKLPAEFKGKLPTAKQLAAVVREILPAKDKP